ncbi:MAG TPA: phosphatase PAP2 family protein [Cytophagaceae bacterium]|nr:phosphatase PAP2 family protein [Cytophagaceae bacterium]
MLEYLKQLDIKMLLAVNSHHTAFLDSLMLFVTNRLAWIPLYILLVIFLIWKKKKASILILFFIILTVVSTDLFASSLMKPLFQRLRPCHNPEVNTMLYMLKDACGGKYGFVSSHASNTFGLVTFLVLLLKKEYPWIILFYLWAALVSLSRVYLGVHYPFDILGGAIVGVGLAFFYFWVYKKMEKKSYKL